MRGVCRPRYVIGTFSWRRLIAASWKGEAIRLTSVGVRGRPGITTSCFRPAVGCAWRSRGTPKRGDADPRVCKCPTGPITLFHTRPAAAGT